PLARMFYLQAMTWCNEGDEMAQPKPGRYRERDPLTGAKMLDGITAIVSERTAEVTYQARWSWSDHGRKRKYGSHVFKDLDTAEEYLLETLLAVKRGTYHPASMLTVDDYATPWMERKLKREDWRSSTYYATVTVWKRVFSPAIGNTPLADLTRYQCQQVARAMEADGIAPGTLRMRMAILTNVLNAAEADGLIVRNPMTRIDLPKVRQTDKVIWSMDQARSFLTATRDDPDHMLWRFLLMTGCRVGEAIALRWRDVNLDKGLVRLRSTRRVDIRGHEIIGEGTKTTARTSTVPLVPDLVAALRAARTITRKGTVVALDGFVFLNARTGERFTDHTLRCHLESVIVAVNAKRPADDQLPRITPHGFRHTAGTLLAALEVPQILIQKILRHKSIQTTANMYLHPDDDLLSAQVAKLGDAMNETGT
ncbi:MAG: tyrosine-type recombinase/integrase, partial [Thermomicrobiales bacterium]